MQTYRAYVRDAAGAITWAAWIEAADLAEANGMAARIGPGQCTLELWSAGERKLAPGSRLEAL